MITSSLSLRAVATTSLPKSCGPLAEAGSGPGNGAAPQPLPVQQHDPDLPGVDIHAADDFPRDDSGYGFEDIGDVLSVSPVLMEKYLAAAEKIVQTALFGPGVIQPTVVRHHQPYRPGTDGGDNSRFAKSLTLPSALHTMRHFPATGEYVFRIDPEGNRPRPSDPFLVALWMDGKQRETVPTDSGSDALKYARFLIPGDWIQAA
jgi:hypothetical protein